MKKSMVKWRPSSFGRFADYKAPRGCNAVVLCVMGGSHYQLHPIQVLLPHQVYEKDCVALLKEHDAKEIVLIPYRSADMVEVGSIGGRTDG